MRKSERIKAYFELRRGEYAGVGKRVKEKGRKELKAESLY
jgi:hypothetical protein